MPAGTPVLLRFSQFSEPRCSCGVWEFGCQPRPEDVRTIDVIENQYRFSHSQLQIPRFWSILCYGLTRDRRF